MACCWPKEWIFAFTVGISREILFRQVHKSPKRLPNNLAPPIKPHTLTSQQLDLFTRMFSILTPTPTEAANTPIRSQDSVTRHLGRERVVPHAAADCASGGVEEGRHGGVCCVSATRDAAEGAVESFAVWCQGGMGCDFVEGRLELGGDGISRFRCRWGRELRRLRYGGEGQSGLVLLGFLLLGYG